MQNFASNRNLFLLITRGKDREVVQIREEIEEGLGRESGRSLRARVSCGFSQLRRYGEGIHSFCGTNFVVRKGGNSRITHFQIKISLE